jgi:hypothetical protein
MRAPCSPSDEPLAEQHLVNVFLVAEGVDLAITYKPHVVESAAFQSVSTPMLSSIIAERVKFEIGGP